MMDEMEQDLRNTLRAMMAPRADVSRDDLVELGWPEVFDDDPRMAVVTLFEEAGRAGVSTAGRDVVVSLMLSDAHDCELTLLEQDGAVDGVPDGGRVQVRSAAATSVPASVVVLDRRGAEAVDLAEVDADPAWKVEQTTGAGVSATLRLVSGHGTLRRRRSRQELEAVDRMLLLAVSHERCGLALGLLDVAVAHVVARQQFGAPIGSFQAVQHRLAGVKVAIEAALSTLSAAWSNPGRLSTMVAVAASAAALAEAVRDCLQVCGGMGFTDEFGAAPLMRRAVIVQAVGPSLREAESLVGTLVVESGVCRIGEVDARREVRSFDE